MFHNMIKAIADSDLLAIDIQRGRDVGIPPYIIVRELCGFPKITSFSDLIGILPPVVSFKANKHLLKYCNLITRVEVSFCLNH